MKTLDYIKMKTKNNFSIIAIFLLAVFTASCVQDDFSIPRSLGDEENAQLQMLFTEVENGSKAMVDIAYVKELFVSGQPVEISSDLVLKGYVTTSDASGNFYKEFFIQDTPSDPTSAIKISADVVDSYNRFNIGRELYIDLKGLSVGEVRSGDGVVTIGENINQDNEVEMIRSLSINAHIFRSPTTETIFPMEVKLSQISNAHLGMQVLVNDVGFVANEKGLPFVDPQDSYDTQRTLEACEGFSKSNFILETSAFANFSQVPIPSGNGSLIGIINKTYNGSDLVLVLNDLESIDLTNSDCELLNLDDFTTVFEEKFDDLQDNTNLNLAGWINVAEEGSELWTEQIFGGNGYTEFSAYRTGDNVNIGWLVTPAFDLGGGSNYINFKTAQHHLDDADNNTLEVFVSADFDGTNVPSATWEEIPVTLPDTSTQWYQFIDAGLIDVSNYSGTLYLAFKYTGSGNNTSLDGGYFVDDVLFLSSN